MGIIRWIGAIFGAIICLLIITGVVARFSDGPIAIFPSGVLEAGELFSGPEPDWSFARDIAEMEFQLVDPPRSRIVWVIVHDRKLYLVSGYMRTFVGRFWKRWPAEAERDGRAVIRIDGRRYERDTVRLSDRTLIEPLAKEARRKYNVPLTADAAETGNAWFFALPPRSSASGT